jgi:hypothetical protein
MSNNCYTDIFGIPECLEPFRPNVFTAAIFGFAMTLLYVVLSIFPIVEVKNASSFSARVGGLVLAINAVGAFHSWRMKQNSHAAAEKSGRLIR